MHKSLLRTFSLFLSLILLLCATSCGKAEEKALTEVDTIEEISFLTKKEYSRETAFLVKEPLTRARLDEIPVVATDMSVDQLRQIVLQYARLSLSFVWQPEEEWYVTLNRNDTFPKNMLYGGIPYVSSAGGNLYKWLCFLDEETGILDVEAVGSEIQTILGNQCSAHAYSAWSRVSNSLSWNGTSQMQEKYGCIKLGNYRYDESIDDFHKAGVDTRDICRDNGKDVMFEAYAKLLPADGLSNYLKSSGHVIMASETKLVRNEDGTIDGKRSYVRILEQTSATKRVKSASGISYRTQAGIDRKFSFNSLYENGYLPFTIPEFAGLDPVEKPTVACDATEERITVAALESAKFSSNYTVSALEVQVHGPSGTLLYEKRLPVISGKLNCAQYTLYRKLNKTAMTTLANGHNTVSVTVWSNTGERVTAYEGTLIPSP